MPLAEAVAVLLAARPLLAGVEMAVDLTQTVRRQQPIPAAVVAAVETPLLAQEEMAAPVS
jgi:hypothetical protein